MSELLIVEGTRNEIDNGDGTCDATYRAVNPELIDDIMVPWHGSGPLPDTEEARLAYLPIARYEIWLGLEAYRPGDYHL